MKELTNIEYVCNILGYHVKYIMATQLRIHSQHIFFKPFFNRLGKDFCPFQRDGIMPSRGQVRSLQFLGLYKRQPSSGQHKVWCLLHHYKIYFFTIRRPDFGLK